MSVAGSPIHRWLRRGLLLLVILLVLDQIALRVFVRDGAFFGRPLLPYSKLELEESGSEFSPRLVADSELGWRLATRAEGGTLAFDWSGGRLAGESLSPRKAREVSRIVVLGGSLALGPQLSASETFAARITAADSARELINLAVPFYGLDQCLGQMRQVRALVPDEVWLCFEPFTALVPTTSQPRRVVPSAPSELTKPPYRLNEAGELAQLTNAPATAELWNSTAGFFSVPGRSEQFFATRFGATLALDGQLEQDKRLRDSNSEAFRTLMLLARKLDRELLAAGIRLRVFLSPNRQAMQRDAQTPQSDWAHFLDELRACGMEVHDLSPLLRAAGGAESSVLWTEGGDWSSGTHELMSNAMQLIVARNP